MIKNKNKNDRKDNTNNSNISNNYNQKDKMKNIILISHSKNKSADFKFSKDNNFKSTKNSLNNSHLKTDFSFKKELNKEKKEINLKNKINKGTNKNILTKNDSLPSLINCNSNSTKNSNKKKYFYEPNFFYKNFNSKENKNKKNITNASYNIQSLFNNKLKIKNDTKNRKINIKSKIPDIINENIQKEDSKPEINYNYYEIDKKLEKKKEIEDSKNCDISSQDNSANDNNNDFIIKNTKIKSNALYIKCKMNKIPYKSKKNINSENRSSFRITWSKKDNKLDNGKDLKRKSGSNIKPHLNLNLLEEDSSSHNTIYDDENNIDYDYINNNFSGKSSEKLYKKIIMRKRNLLSESFNKSNLNLNQKCFSNKRFSLNKIIPLSERGLNIEGGGPGPGPLSPQFLYRKVNTKRIPSSSNALLSDKKKNYYSSYSFSSTKYQSNSKSNRHNIKANIITNKDVTEFLYTEDLTENNQNKTIKKILSDIGLPCYFSNFYENNINDLAELNHDLNKIGNKNDLYEYFENTFRIRTPGHIYRILIKLEIEEGSFDNKITNFLISKEENENNNNLNRVKPSYFLMQNNSCENCLSCCKDRTVIIKNNLKNFLKRYHLLYLYYNFYQNGFDSISYVLLQMYSNYYAIDEYILENCFHIYNKEDRSKIFEALLSEKMKINSFLNSDKFKNDKNNIYYKYENMNLNSNITFDNFDNYFNGIESEENNCNICEIY